MTTERAAGLREAIRQGLRDSTADATDGHTLMAKDAAERIEERVRAAVLDAPVAVDREALADAINQTDIERFWLPEGVTVDEAADWLWDALAARLREPKGADHDR